VADDFSTLRTRVGDALVAVDVWAVDTGLSLAGFGISPSAGPMLQRLGADLRRATTLAGAVPADYQVLSLADGLVVVVIGHRRGGAVLLAEGTALVRAVTEVVPALRETLDRF